MCIGIPNCYNVLVWLRLFRWIYQFIPDTSPNSHVTRDEDRVIENLVFQLEILAVERYPADKSNFVLELLGKSHSFNERRNVANEISG